jgi:hypothetical protein
MSPVKITNKSDRDVLAKIKSSSGEALSTLSGSVKTIPYRKWFKLNFLQVAVVTRYYDVKFDRDDGVYRLVENGVR